MCEEQGVSYEQVKEASLKLRLNVNIRLVVDSFANGIPSHMGCFSAQYPTALFGKPHDPNTT
jgi:hypothetical protein